MKQFLLAGALGIAFAAAQLHPALAASTEPLGTWLTEDGQARVRVERCAPAGETGAAQNVCGYIVWLRTPNNPDGTIDIDEHNPDPSRQNRALLGMQIILGLKPNEDGRYEGRIYDADRGKDFDVEIWSPRPEEMKVKGCLIAFLCKTQTWKRVAAPTQGELTGATGAEGGPIPNPEWTPAPQGEVAPQ